ncbi:MAG: hypothetical protein R2991_16535 [Thermoanaerobaculia bacterium]
MAKIDQHGLPSDGDQVMLPQLPWSFLMPCPMVVGRFPFALPVTSSEESWQPLSKPLVIVGGESLDFALTISRATGNAKGIPGAAYLTARPDISGTPSEASGSYSGSQGTTHHAFDLSGTDDEYFAQAGILTKLDGGSTAGFIQGYLSVHLRACAMPIGQRFVEVRGDQTTTPSTDLLGRVPASGAASLRAALVCNGINDIEYRFFVRGVNDPEEPESTWTGLGAGYTALPESTPMAICQSDLSVSGVTPSNFHELDFSIRLKLTGGGSTPTGSVKVSAGLSYT